MVIKHNQNSLLNKFTKKFKNTWQSIFLPSALAYGSALLHFFYTKPKINHTIEVYFRNIDLTSYIIAISIAVLIFNLKRKYFSRKYSRKMIDSLLKVNPEYDTEALLKKIFADLHSKMKRVWILGGVLILEGVLFYIITSVSDNMHIYFVIGAYSLMVNYPRNELFEDIPWYVIQEIKAYEKENEK